MTFAINLALLLVGTIAALAAFGGETWKKSDEPLIRRVTRRGWLALMCMLATLTLGIVKEIKNNATAAAAAAAADAAANAAAAKQAELESIIDSTKQELIAASKEIKRQSQLLDLIKINSQRQVQMVMDEYIKIKPNMTWVAPNMIYPGSIIKAFF